MSFLLAPALASCWTCARLGMCEEQALSTGSGAPGLCLYSKRPAEENPAVPLVQGTARGLSQSLDSCTLQP